MSIVQLRHTQSFALASPAEPGLAHIPHGASSFVALLIQERLVAPHQILTALKLLNSRHNLVDILIAQGVISSDAIYGAMARYWSVGVADLIQVPPDTRLTKRVSHITALREGLLPWRRIGDYTVIVTAYPDEFYRQKRWLEEEFGKVIMAIAPWQAIEAAMLRSHGKQLSRLAEMRTAASESCRNYKPAFLRNRAATLIATCAIATYFAPIGVLLFFTALAIFAMFSANILKFVSLFGVTEESDDTTPPIEIAHLPVVSIMVALFREDCIAPRLAARLEKLDYPRELLDILLVVEAEDHLTRDALAQTNLPEWMRIIVVPRGEVKTKPRALNYALDHCRGSIIGIYDAEDAPEPDQIRKIVTRFYQRGPEVVCLQGRLDYYNPRTNWLSRCFTIEYAAWFRVFLPGIARLGLAIPLGGTTVFFRKHALEELGGWDAQNVTEDADLGMRIYRHGYRTELVETTTYEEANCRGVAWVKQRSRWIKGYMMTYMTHMRSPRLLLRQLGLRRFVGFQVQFMAGTVQTLLAPFLWSFWIMPFGMSHPFAAALPYPFFILLSASMILIAMMLVAIDIKAMRKTRHGLNPLWAVTLLLYQPLSTLAAYKALWELLTRPFYWDKTSHGHFDL